MNIHKTAIVDPKAELASDISVGPYAIIRENVCIGSGTKVGAHCVIEEFTTIGRDCDIFSGAIIGSVTQDKKFKGAKSFLRIGDNNVIREYVTINRSTSENGTTSIGSNNLFMAYSHIAHDCQIADNAVLANCGTLAGHVVLENNVTIGGLAGVHQFVRMGEFSIVGGCSKVVQDLVPYSMSDGHPAKIYGVNSAGLDRANFPEEAKTSLKKAFKILFSMQLNVKNALDKIIDEIPPTKETTRLIDFIKSSERGIAR